jgi:GT2 family glycosyltransferase
MHNESPEISVIICSYNTKDLTLDCLDRLKKSIDNLDKKVETIMVENGSDGTGEVVKKKCSWVKIIEPSENTGFARGYNIGIKASNKNSKYCLLLNTDALIKPDTLQKAIIFMEKHNDCDVLSCRLVFGDGKFQPSGGYLPTPFSVATWILGIDLLPKVSRLLNTFHQKNMSFFEADRQVGWVMGAFLFMRQKVIEKTKGMDENFFMYMEEVEWCKRISDSGFKIWYTPSFEIIHLDKTSSKSDPEKFRKIFQKEILGVIYFLKKYYPNQITWVILVIKFGLFARWMAFFVLGNKTRQFAYLETLRAI